MNSAPMNATVSESTVPDHPWPDPLRKPTREAVAHLLRSFWECLGRLPELITRREDLLADQLTTQLRGIVLEMMLALNGIQWPAGTRHLNSYLSVQQRAAIEKTMVLPHVSAEAWIGRAVALIVIYRWYAPQLVAHFQLEYPAALEAETWAALQQLPDWPLTVTTED